MEKKTTLAILLSAVLVLSFGLVPKVSSQPEDIRINSYGWYIDSLGYFVVVGEIQNVGPNILDTVALSGIVYTIDGTAQASSYAQAYVNNLLPQQRAPFYMEFNPGSSSTGDLGWIYIGVDRVDFAINVANVTNYYQYPDLIIQNSTGTIDAEGVCWVSGTIQNTGSQAASNVRIIGTFYNASGTAIATGYTDAKPSISPSGSASFKLGAFDLNQTEVPSSLKISNYSLLIQIASPLLQAETPLPPGGPPSLPPAPILPITTASSDTPPSTNPPPSTEPSDSNSGKPFPQEYIYVIVGVAVGLVLAVTAVALQRRRSQANTRQKLQVRKQQRAQSSKRKNR